jgi:hypothetical protein
MKTCSKCGTTKALDQFSIKNKETGTRNAWCKTCNREYQKLHYQNNKQVYRNKARAYEAENGGNLGKRLRLYHLSESAYLEMLQKHSGMCWICKTRPATVIDHDHSCCFSEGSCGKCVRGLLCGGCNSGLGLLGDTELSLRNALEYLVR